MLVSHIYATFSVVFTVSSSVDTASIILQSRSKYSVKVIVVAVIKIVSLGVFIKPPSYAGYAHF